MENPENSFEIKLKFDLRWVYLPGFFLIFLLSFFPVVVPTWSPQIEWGKTIFFRIIFSILLFVFVSHLIFKKNEFSEIKQKIKLVSLPFWLLISFLGINLLATIFSLDPNFSLWGNPDRSGGFLNLAFYILFSIFAFLVIPKNDWRKIWNFAILVGVIVSVIAIIQRIGLFDFYLIPFLDKPVSTLGNSILLATYLLLLTFISLVFGIKEKNRYIKIFYFIAFFLFLSVSILLTQSRGAVSGLIIGFLWLFFGYRFPKKSGRIKIYAAAFLVLVIFLMFGLKIYMDSHLYVYKKIPPIISHSLDRTLSIFEGTKIMTSRISAWKVSLEALKDHPILGYGPENFMIGFDKHYDPALPIIGVTSRNQEMVQWWDRAHNFLLDIPITTGIPALIIYLSLFVTLFWKLEKIKRKTPQNTLICHGIQATFIGYLGAIFFSFDTFETFLISFLFIAYSLYFISESNSKISNNPHSVEELNTEDLSLYRKIGRFVLVPTLFILLISFIWSFNLKPFKINKELFSAFHLSESKECNEALKMTEIFNSKTIISNYIKQRYATNVLFPCLDKTREQPANVILLAVQILKKNTDEHPVYLQNWILLAEYTNILIEEKNKLTDNVFVNTPEMEKLKNETNYYFEKAHLLSPKRQIVLKEWAKTEMITEEYQKAEEKIKECIDLNQTDSAWYWYMALNRGYQKDYEGLKKFSALAGEKGYNIESADSLQQLINMYIRNNNYNGLAEVYPKLISLTADPSEKAQLHASLASVYKDLGEKEKAKYTALKILELIPLIPKEKQEGARKDVEDFLKTLQ